MQKHNLDMLGPHVEIASREVPQEEVIKNDLRSIGKKLSRAIPDGNFTYCGSVCSHYYTNEFGREVRFVHHHVFDKPLNEKVLSTGMADLAVHLMKVLFGREKPSTTNPRDQRGKKDI